MTSKNSSSSSSSSSSSAQFPRLTYDVFLSFRGIDTRNNFSDHLYSALKQKGIFTFRDDEELGRGESIGPNLLKAIEESRYVIVVFSQNYADSSWCLDEIAKVADCMKTMGQKVLPVFYHVDPSDVRRQTGDHFVKAFVKHQKRFQDNPYKVQRWRDALFHVGSLSGWHLQDGYESKVIQEIVEMIFLELNPLISISKGLVGMESHMNEMLSHLAIGCPDVRIIGICGMGGIGKSTIAQVVFDRVQTHFEGCSFLENVKELIEKQGVVHLQEQLLSNILKCNVSVHNTKTGKDIIMKRLCTKKVLLILDNVDQDEQLEAICNREWFGPGSRIIITTRDEHLLREADKVYKVNPLTDDEALELFHMKAFKKDQDIGEDFLQLSKEFLKYANGLPLAIKVLGSSVHSRNVKIWSSALGRLKNNPPKKIIDVLRLSFDGLEESEKKMFLDIACFFKGDYIQYVIDVLQGGEYSPDIDVEVLVDKSLVTLFGRKLLMHDLVQEMGWEIVRDQCRDEIGKRSRLWLPNEIIHVLGQSKGTSAVQSISLQCPTEDDIVHSIDNGFSNMDRLRLLRISGVKFSGTITYLSNELQYLYWKECPLDSFPSDFQPDKLVQVHMYYSRIKQLWRGKKGWRMLRLIDLSGSHYLISTPDFTEVPELETLILRDCSNLVEIHPSLGNLKKLLYLDMKNCKSIQSLPPFTILNSLRMLRLSLCSGLKKFPEIEGNMMSLLELHLDGTSIVELPPSIERLTGLTLLNLTDCKDLLHLPDTMQCLIMLESLYLTGCSAIVEIPNLNDMTHLKTLFIGGTSIKELSFIAGMKNLRYLSCRGCRSVVSDSCKSLALLSSLISLDLSYCNLMDGAFLNDLGRLISLRGLDLSGNCFVRLPESISQFSELRTLKLSYCRHLQLLPKKLPLSLREVIAQDCTSLTDYPDQIKVLTSSELGVTIVHSAGSSALAESSSSWFNREGSSVMHVIHKYTDGKQVDHYMSPKKTVIDKICRWSIFVSPTDEIPDWFYTISIRNLISIPIHPNDLTDDNTLKGFAACAIFSVKGHTDLSVIEPDPDFCSYSYQMTFETDVMRLEPRVWPQAGADKDSSLGSSSHLLITFYTSISEFNPGWELDESSVVRALFETTNPSMVVQKCAIRPVYDQDAGWDSFFWCSLIFLNDPDTIADTLVLESAWLNQSSKREKFVPPLEEESTVVRRKNLESVLPRYLEAMNRHYARFIFNFSGSPCWFRESFGYTRSSFTKESIDVPQNLHKNKKWKGFAIFASLVKEVGQTVKEDYYRLFIGLTNGNESDKYEMWSEEVPMHSMSLSNENHQLLILYIPRAQILEMSTQTVTSAIDVYMKIIDSPYVNVQRCGFRIVYQEDIQGFADTIIRCMQRESSLETYDKLVVEGWLGLIRLQGACMERRTERDSRTPREKYCELQSRKYRNWDWRSDVARLFFCGFERAEISKWKWFMSFISQGNSAEVQLPPNVFDDDNWLGFAVCSWLYHDQCPSTSFGTALDSENVMLYIRLHSDVDWNGLFDFPLQIHLTVFDLTWFTYIPRTAILSKMWSRCKLARVTMRSTNHPCLAVYSCAIRLVYKKDVEHLVETLTLAELP